LYNRASPPQKDPVHLFKQQSEESILGFSSHRRNVRELPEVCKRDHTLNWEGATILERTCIGVPESIGNARIEQ